jgi:ABC-type nitrate/sulfonate/bicarbonate transport system ATPase subunit
MAAQRKTVVMVTHDFDEAVYLSESVFVMSRHPGRIVHEFPVALDRRGAASKPYCPMNLSGLSTRSGCACQ